MLENETVFIKVCPLLSLPREKIYFVLLKVTNWFLKVFFELAEENGRFLKKQNWYLDIYVKKKIQSLIF